MENILEVKDLHVYYDMKTGIFQKKKEQKHALKGLSFTMKEGEILGLVGESGCGKTSLAKAILGMQKDYQGEIICRCENPQMVFQDPYSSLNPSKKVGWILEEPLKMQKRNVKLSREERRQKVNEMLRKVGLDEKMAEHYPSELSGGQRQRVCIAAALMSNTRLLIADEPVSALDVTIQAQIIQLLFKLQQEMGIAILFISHDLRVVYQLCERMLIMKKGEIIERGTTDEVYEHPKMEYTKTLLEAAGCDTFN